MKVPEAMASPPQTAAAGGIAAPCQIKQRACAGDRSGGGAGGGACGRGDAGAHAWADRLAHYAGQGDGHLRAPPGPPAPPGGLPLSWSAEVSNCITCLLSGGGGGHLRAPPGPPAPPGGLPLSWSAEVSNCITCLLSGGGWPSSRTAWPASAARCCLWLGLRRHLTAPRALKGVLHSLSCPGVHDARCIERLQCAWCTSDQPCSLLSAPHCQSPASPRMGRWLSRLILCVTALGLTCSCC